MSHNPADLHCDVFISGGGPVGLLFALGLAKQQKKVVLAEKYLPQLETQSALESVKNAFDGRVLALSKGSVDFLNEIDVWTELQQYTTAIEHVHVSQKGYMGITTLHADEVDVEALGYSVRSQDLGSVLWGLAKQDTNITLLSPATLNSFSEQDDSISVNVDLTESKQQQIVHCQLVVGADGTASKVRHILDLPMEQKSYQAYGVLAQIETEEHPQGWAYERFTTDGPVALLPMFGHAHKAVMVCPEEQIEEVKALSDSDYIQLFAEKMGERLGRFTQVSQRIVYPLNEAYAPQMSKGRALLMGNASHTQHPVAAQGLNLGIRDIESFLQQFKGRQDLGEKAALQSYALSREDDHKNVMGMTDSLIQIFQHHSPLVGHLRGIGLMAMQAMPKLKRRFSKFAMRGRQS